MVTSVPSRFAALITEVRDASRLLPWYNDIAGLSLDIDYLRELGASSQILQWWVHARPLLADVGPTRRSKNHLSFDKLVSGRKLSGLD